MKYENNLVQILQKKFGFGILSSTVYLEKLGLKPQTLESGLTKKQRILFLNFISNIDIKLEKKKILDSYVSTNSYKGRRLQYNLPLNGSNTKNNAKTRKKFKII